MEKRGRQQRLKKACFSAGVRLISRSCFIPFRSRAPVGLLLVKEPEENAFFYISGYHTCK